MEEIQNHNQATSVRPQSTSRDQVDHGHTTKRQAHPGANMKKIQEAIVKDEAKSKKRSQHAWCYSGQARFKTVTRLRSAINLPDEVKEYLERVARCNSHKRCNSFHCDFCHTAFTKRCVDKSFDLFRDVTRENMHFVTIIIDVHGDIKKLLKSKKAFAKKMQNCLNNNAPGVRVYGAFEIDYCENSAFSKPLSHKAATFSDFGIDASTSDCPDGFYVLHIHALVDSTSIRRHQLQNI